MIRKLRNRFIAIASLSLFFVLASIILVINIINYSNIASSADGLLNIMAQNGGVFPNDPPAQKEPNGRDEPRKGNEETPYQIRYFYVKYNNDSFETNLDHIAKVDEESAVSYYLDATESESTRGYVDTYRYYKKDTNFVIFLDCESDFDTCFEFLRYCLIIASVGYVAVFALVCLFSRRAIKPMAESYEKQKRFITDSSHELKTPLTIISANNELLEMNYGENESCTIIAKQVDRMTAMVKNLTLLSRLTESEKLSSKSVFSFSDILVDVSSLFKAPIGRANKTYQETIAPDIYVLGDESLMRQVISILFDNAVKYSKTFIDLNLSRQGNKMLLVLKNDSENVKKGNLNRCLERFYRSDEMRASSIQGSGIGLSIAKEIIDLHSGKIECMAKVDNVFEIHVLLPIKKLK